MKPILLLFALFFAGNAFAQQDTIFVRYPDNSNDHLTYLTDTVLQEYGINHPYMVGTCIIPGTAGQSIARNNGVYFNKISKSPCNSSEEKAYNSNTRINSYELKDNSLMVDMTFIDNCCYEFLCDVDMDDNGILHLRYTGYGSLCACMCCFGVVYHFELDRTWDGFNLKGIMYEDQAETLILFKE